MQLTTEEIHQGLRARTIQNEIVPMLCGSAFKNKGVQMMLDAVVYYLPAPTRRARREGQSGRQGQHPDRTPSAATTSRSPRWPSRS